MNIRKSKNTTCVVKKVKKIKNGSEKMVVVGYLTHKHEEQGFDSFLDQQGYIIEAI